VARPDSLWLKVRGRIGFAIGSRPSFGPVQTADGDENRVEPDEKAESDCVRTIPVAGRLSSVYFDPRQQLTST
jgi:hypothetical protein